MWGLGEAGGLQTAGPRPKCAAVRAAGSGPFARSVAAVHPLGMSGAPTTLSTQLFPRYKEELRLRGFSPRTIAAYSSCLRRYVNWLRPMHPRDAEDERMRRYLLELTEAGASRSMVSQSVSALKFLYVRLYHQPPAAFDVPPHARPEPPARAEPPVITLAAAPRRRGRAGR